MNLEVNMMEIYRMRQKTVYLDRVLEGILLPLLYQDVWSLIRQYHHHLFSLSFVP